MWSIVDGYSMPTKSSKSSTIGIAHGPTVDLTPTFDSVNAGNFLLTTLLTGFIALISSLCSSRNVVTSWGSEKYTSSSRPHPEKYKNEI